MSWFARHGKAPAPRDPLYFIDLLLLEDLMQRQKPDVVRRGRAFETVSIVAAVICVIALLLHASWAGTTVVVASPPPFDAATSPGEPPRGP
jgi:hypothetical protein